MSIENFIRALPPDRVALVCKDRELKAEELLTLVLQRRWLLADRSERNFVLACESSLDNIVWMLALDGIAHSVFLAPKSVRESDAYSGLLALAKCEAVISQSTSIEKLEGISETKERLADLASSNTAWLLATSGTTGTPKLIRHTTDSLTRTVNNDIQKGAHYRWALIYDPFRFAGLQVVLQCLAAGSSLLLCHEDDFKEQVKKMNDHAVNALSATPTYWRKIIMDRGLLGREFKQVTLGGEPCDQSILTALSSAFPNARITHIYASTEAGVGFSVTDGRAGFPTKFMEEGVAGSQLRVADGGSLKIRPAGKVGELANGTALTDSTGYIDTGDLVERRGDRYYFLGRLSGAINVGGNKVIPEEVEQVIRCVPGVADVIVKGKGSPVTGSLVVAEVLPVSAIEDVVRFKKTILDQCRNQLDRYKVPALLKIVDSLPTNSTGKLVRN